MQTCLRVILFLALLVLIPAREAVALTKTYELGPGDKLRVNVSEWSAGEARTRLEGEFSVDPSGDLSLPLVGQLQATGLTPSQLSRSISEQMQEKAGLLNPPVTSVEIIEYRPFYVLGNVERPGAYPYRPGMLVVHAVTLSGGLQRTTDTGLLRIELDAINARGNVQVHESTIEEQTARLARLQAELEDREIITFPLEIDARKGEPSVSQSMRQEEALRSARRQRHETEIKTRKRTRSVLEQQSKSFEAQLAAQEQRIEILRRELNELKSLIERGVIPAPRRFSAESALADAEFRKKELQSQLLEAQKSIVQEEQAIDAIMIQRRTDLLSEIDQATRNLEEARSRLRTAQSLVSRSGSAVEALGDTLLDPTASPIFVILREESGIMRDMVASETTPVMPGDVVKVELVRKGASRDRRGPLGSRQETIPLARSPAETN